MKKQLQQINQHLQSLTDDFDAAGYITQARELALAHGNGQAAKLCRMPHGLISVMEAREIIASMIGTIQEPEPDLLSIDDICELLSVSPATVKDWIESKQLKASNLNSGNRPRYVIERSELEAFLKFRQG